MFFEFAGDRADALRVIKEAAPSPATDGEPSRGDTSRCPAREACACATERAGAIASTVARP